MTVYVDDMHKYPMGKYRRMKMSHMIATSEEELHEMAKSIGVARKWYQGDHYDICKSKRDLAVSLGAVEITWRQTAALVKQAALLGENTSPEEAETWYIELIRKRMDERGKSTG